MEIFISMDYIRIYGYMDKRHRRFKNKFKKLFVIFLCMVSLSTFSGCFEQSKDKIVVTGANALQPLMEIWAREYRKIHPEIKITVTGGGAGKGMTEALAGNADIGMVSRDIRKEEISQGAFWVSVARDAVVATINENNPVKDIILSKGLTREQLEEIFISRGFKTWGQLVGNESITSNIVVYTRQDACGAAEMWAKFLGENYKQDNLTNAADVAIIEDAPLRDAVSRDIYAIGYNNINTVYNPETKKPYPGILPVPIDLNSNGYLEEDEKFYDNISSLTAAISKNIYPSPPARDLHLVTKNNFTGIVRDFVYWILTDGQQYISLAGYVPLSEEKIQQEIEYLLKGERPQI